MTNTFTEASEVTLKTPINWVQGTVAIKLLQHFLTDNKHIKLRKNYLLMYGLVLSLLCMEANSSYN